MNYNQALQYIHGSLKFGSKLGLQNITNLLELMGNVHKKLKYIHVAGTNGKGSTTAMITNILRHSGYKVGMYTSPYIEEFTERIQINGEKINKDRLAEITLAVKNKIGIMLELGYNHPTEFEIVTAIAFQYYYEEKCDFVVLEVGLGGRFDATNVIESSLVSVITSISMDHMEYLGDSIEEIAFEKCGIIKNNTPVVTYPHQHEKVMNVINKVADDRNCPVIIPDLSSFNIISDTLDGIEFDYDEYKKIKINLLGKHQALNAIMAITVVKTLKDYYNISLKENSIRLALEKTRWPGRFEILSFKPTFVIDGAHNVSGVDALMQSINTYFGDKEVTFIVGMLKDKEYKSCIKQIAQRAQVLIATKPENHRALKTDEIVAVAKDYCNNVTIRGNIHEAIEQGIKLTSRDGIICCCGSLYLIGSVRSIFKEFYK